MSQAKLPPPRHAGCRRPAVHSQRGITLLVALIFLVLFAVMAGAALNNTLTSSQAIGNMQFRSEAIAAADDAIDQVLSSTAFAINTTGFTAQVNATPFRVDINGDGTDDITVNFPAVTIDGVTRAGPRCIRFQSIPTDTLNEESPNDIGCFGSSAAETPGLGNAEAGGGPGTNAFAAAQSVCANTDWVIPVRATEPATSTSVDVVQGVGVRVFISDARNSCED